MVLAAARRGIVGEVPGEQSLCGSVRRALHAAIEADTRLRERHLHAAADAAADDGIDAVRCEQLGRALVQLAAGRHDLARLHGAVRDRIDLERRGLAEMLEDLLRAFVIGNADFHGKDSFLSLGAKGRRAGSRARARAELIAAALDDERPPLDERRGEPHARRLVERLRRRARDAELRRASRLRQPLVIHEAQALELLERETDGRTLGCALRAERGVARQLADAALLAWSCHRNTPFT